MTSTFKKFSQKIGFQSPKPPEINSKKKTGTGNLLQSRGGEKSQNNQYGADRPTNTSPGMGSDSKATNSSQKSYVAPDDVKEHERETLQDICRDTSHFRIASSQGHEASNLVEVAEMWAAAYESLTFDEQELMADYQDLVSTSWKLPDGIDTGSQIQDYTTPKNNDVDQPSNTKLSKRREFLIGALEASLVQDFEDGDHIGTLFSHFKKTIQTLSHRTPNAILAWVALYFSAENLCKGEFQLPKEFSSHVHIFPRIEWYSYLATLRIYDGMAEDPKLSQSYTWPSTDLKNDWIALFKIILRHFIRLACTSVEERQKAGLISAQFEQEILKQEEVLITNASGDQTKQDLVKFVLLLGKSDDGFESLIPPSFKRLSLIEPHDIHQRDVESISMESKVLDSIELPKSDSKILKYMQNWAMSNSCYTEFRHWDPNTGKRALLVRGPPGSGKMNLLLAMANQLLEEKIKDTNAPNVAWYFYNHASAIAVELSSMVYQLIRQVVRDQPHVKQFVDQEGTYNFNKPPDFTTALRIFRRIIECDEFHPTYFLLDGLDEYISSGGVEAEAEDILNMIFRKSDGSDNKLKWLISSEKEFTDFEIPVTVDQTPTINLGPENVDNGLAPALKEAAALEIDAFLQGFCVKDEFRSIVEALLFEKSTGNLLWLKLASKIINSYRAPWNAPGILKKLGGSVDDLYQSSGDRLNDLLSEDLKICKEILLVMATAHRPLRIIELRMLAEVPPEVDLERMITSQCCYFLEIRDYTVYFAHPSAKSYLRRQNNIIQVNSKAHSDIARKCLYFLSETLQKKNIHDLYCSDGNDALQQPHYAAMSWVKHLTQIDDLGDDDEISRPVASFFEIHLLQWLDIMKSMYHVSDIVLDVARLVDRLSQLFKKRGGDPGGYLAYVEDAAKFLRFHNNTNTPAKFSAKNTMLFYPSINVRKKLLEREFPWLSAVSSVDDSSQHVIHSLKGHDDWIRCCACSPDGRFVVSSSDDRTAKVWDRNKDILVNKCILRPWTRDWVRRVTYSSSGQLAALSDYNTIDVWESSTYSHLRTIRKQELEGQEADITGNFRDLAFSPDGKKLATATNQAFVVWSLSPFEAKVVRTEAAPGQNSCLRFFKDDEIAIGSSGAISFWSMKGDLIRSIDANAISLVFSPSYKILASHSEDETVRLWNPDSGELMTTFSSPESSVISISISFDNAQLASASDDGIIRIWDLDKVESQEGQETKQPELTFTEQAGVMSVQFLAKQHLLVSGSKNGILRVCDTRVVKFIGPGPDPRSTNVSATTKRRKQNYPISFLTFSPDGKLLASASEGDDIFIWDGDTGEFLISLESEDGDIKWLQFSLDGSMLASSHDDGYINIWKTEDGFLLSSHQSHDDWVRCVKFSPDGHQIASASDDKTIKVWKIPSEMDKDGLQAIHELSNDDEWAFTIGFSSEGNRLASGGNYGGIRVWDLTASDVSGSRVTLRDRTQVHAIAFLPDGERLISSTGRCLRLWNCKTGNFVREITDLPTTFRSLRLRDDSTGYIFTEAGVYPIDSLFMPSDAVSDVTQSSTGQSWKEKSRTPLSKASLWPYGLNADESIITWRDKDLIFLPERYRPYDSGDCTTWIHERKIGIGCESGLVMLFNFADKPDPTF